VTIRGGGALAKRLGSEDRETEAKPKTWETVRKGPVVVTWNRKHHGRPSCWGTPRDGPKKNGEREAAKDIAILKTNIKSASRKG